MVAKKPTNSKLAGETAGPASNSAERRVVDALEWIDRLDAFYRYMNDEPMQKLLAIERDRLSRRKDAYVAVRLGTLRYENSSTIRRAVKLT